MFKWSTVCEANESFFVFVMRGLRMIFCGFFSRFVDYLKVN